MKKIILGAEAREKILGGTKKIADVVKLTLGPRGRNVLLDRGGAEPLITNDGVTIANEAEFECPFENIGARVLREASMKTNQTAGDGTTTAVLLAAEIIEKGLRRIELGSSPVLVKQGLEKAAEFVLKILAQSAKPISTFGERAAIAASSCGSSADGNMVAEAVGSIGANGIITVEENKNGKTALTFVEGLELDCALASPYFCEDVQGLSVTFENAKILITDQKIQSVKEILPILEAAAREKFPLVIIADDFTPEVVSALVINKVRAGIRVAALRCGIGTRRSAVLEDLAAFTDATVISAANDLRPALAEAGHLGNCGKVIMGLETAKFISGGTARLAERVTLIKAQVAKALADGADEYSQARLAERLARLTNGVAVISVGAPSEIEQKEKRLRIEDAVNATKAACGEGIVAGGGAALLGVKKKLKKYITEFPKNLKDGAEILYDCLESPMRQICLNCDQNPDIIVSKCSGRVGFDALNLKVTDMFEANIVDPVKVVKSALRNAVSVAGTLLTTEAIIC